MNYGFGKTYTIPAAFTALNGCVQHYVLETAVELDVAPVVDEKTGEISNIEAVKESQANLLKVLEILRTYGAQPIITKVAGKTVDFTLEQANVFGNGGLKAEINGDQQVSKKAEAVDGVHGFIAGAEAKIEEMFGEAKAVDGTTKLFASVKVEDAFEPLR